MFKIKVIENTDHRKVTYLKSYKKKTSKYKGIYFRKNVKRNPWIVKLIIKQKSYFVGCYPTEDIAAKVYDLAAIKLLVKAPLNKEIHMELDSIELSEVIFSELAERLAFLKESLEKKETPPKKRPRRRED